MLATLTPTRRARKKAATKERLYAEALNLFRRQGYAATTVEAIAAAAQVSRGTFFNYFPGKDALLHYLSDRLAAAAAETLTAALAGPAGGVRARLSRLGQALAATVEADRELARVAVFARLTAPAADPADPHRQRLRQVVSALLLEGQRWGEVAAGLDPDLWSSALTGVYYQQIFEWCAAADQIPIIALIEQELNGQSNVIPGDESGIAQ